MGHYTNLLTNYLCAGPKEWYETNSSFAVSWVLGEIVIFFKKEKKKRKVEESGSKPSAIEVC